MIFTSIKFFCEVRITTLKKKSCIIRASCSVSSAPTYVIVSSACLNRPKSPDFWKMIWTISTKSWWRRAFTVATHGMDPSQSGSWSSPPVISPSSSPRGLMGSRSSRSTRRGTVVRGN